MDRQIEHLVEKVKSQEEVLLEMKSKIEQLEDLIIRLSVCKLSDPSYPYYNFIVLYGITPDQQTSINRLFMALSEKLAGNQIPEGLKSKAEYSTDFLFSDKPIQYENVKCSIMKILNVSDGEIPLSLINSMKSQEMNVTVCDYLLSQLDS
ncbi:MAG: hypothetical protein ACQEW5_24870 [Bacillota bacterium]